MDTQKLNLVMAMYAVFLASGHTISCKQIKAKTIKNYLFAAATFIRLFDQEPQRDARCAQGTSTTSPFIQKVLHQVEKFETMPERKEPYTLAMQKEFYQQIQTSQKSDPDGLEVALFEWFGTALQGGNRRCEWCQDSSHKDLESYELNALGEARAFTLEDITFQSAWKKDIKLEDALRYPATVQYALVKYRWQKNGYHGEVKTYARNSNNRACDAVGHLLNICARFVRLCGIERTDLPLAVYKSNDGKVQFITSTDVCRRMRALAKTVYDITSKKALEKWSPHSLRVGACCILWAKGISGAQIQRLLRWRSEAWKDYIRDLTTQSHQQNDAITACWDLPTY